MLKKKDIVYFARIIPKLGIYDVCELIVRTVADTWFVGLDKHDKHAFLLNNSCIGKTVFLNRGDALEKVLTAETMAEPQQSFEKYYEEY